MRGQAGFWDVDERYARLSEAGDPLERLTGVVSWEMFRQPLAEALKRSDGAKGGRPPHDPVMMFKILILQGAVQSFRRSGRIPDHGPAHLRSVPWSSGCRRQMSEATSRANGRRSKVRVHVEHVFAQQKARMGLFVRTIGIAGATAKIGMVNLAYNMTRYVWRKRQAAPA